MSEVHPRETLSFVIPILNIVLLMMKPVIVKLVSSRSVFRFHFPDTEVMVEIANLPLDCVDEEHVSSQTT